VKTPTRTAFGVNRAAVVPIRAGQWTAELVGDELAHIAFAGEPLLRAIRVVVRDYDWRTVPARLARLNVLRGDSNVFESELLIEFRGFGVSFDAAVALRVGGEEFRVSFQSVALNAFRRNRIGLVILHSADDAGRRVRVCDTSGGTTASEFPEKISPYQPFKNIAKMAWRRGLVDAELGFQGETFETEDQRNWTDDSFKTYGTPLELPFPVDIAVGDVVSQSVLLLATCKQVTPRPRAHTSHRDTVKVELGGPTRTLPTLGLTASHIRTLPASTSVPLCGACCPTLLLEIRENDAAWEEGLNLAVIEADNLGAELDVRVVAGDEEGLRSVVAALPLGRVRRLAVYDPASYVTSERMWQHLKDAAVRHSFSGDLVGGTCAHFAELNRNAARIPADLAGLTFSVTPQMHVTETEHIVESIAAQRVVARDAVQLSAGRPIHIGPVTLKARFNAVATSGPSTPEEDACAAIDVRQTLPFTAAWTLASIDALTRPGVASLTYYEARGPRGIAACSGDRYPVGDLITSLFGHEAYAVLAVRGTIPSDTTIFPLQGAKGVDVYLGNLSDQPRTLHLRLPSHLRHADALECARGGESQSAVVHQAPEGTVVKTTIPGEEVCVVSIGRRPAETT